jgi:hypothetical protein
VLGACGSRSLGLVRISCCNKKSKNKTVFVLLQQQQRSLLQQGPRCASPRPSRLSLASTLSHDVCVRVVYTGDVDEREGVQHCAQQPALVRCRGNPRRPPLWRHPHTPTTPRSACRNQSPRSACRHQGARRRKDKGDVTPRDTRQGCAQLIERERGGESEGARSGRVGGERWGRREVGLVAEAEERVGLLGGGGGLSVGSQWLSVGYQWLSVGMCVRQRGWRLAWMLAALGVVGCVCCEWMNGWCLKDMHVMQGQGHACHNVSLSLHVMQGQGHACHYPSIHLRLNHASLAAASASEASIHP